MTGDDLPFWERPEVVARFAERDPDHRLRALVDRWEEPAAARVLDVGCAGGRNTVFLAERGFDVHALDASQAMAAETRRRLAEVLGPAEARERVRVGRMDDLSRFGDGSCALVVSLGVLHDAASWEEWRAAVAEAARVLEPGGLLLVAHFTPGTSLSNEPTRPVAGSRHLWEGVVPDRALVLLEADELDAAMAEAGLEPEEPTAVVEGESERGRRVTANALYRKRG